MTTHATDEAVFREFFAPHQRELLVHCYRILGSYADAEDALQDALLKAWRGLAGFEGRSSARRWLYTIATRASLDLLAERKARSLPPWVVEASDGRGPLPAPSDLPWVEPLPEVADPAPNPEARTSYRESVALAFIVMLQGLPANQRAALLLRDVAGFSAAETAEILDLTVPAANSALQRARQAVADGPDRTSDETPDPELLGRFVRALESCDADALIGLLARDATFSMPPWPLWLSGPDAIRTFATGVLFADPVMRDQRLVPVRANGGPAFAAYTRDPATGTYRATSIDVVVVRGGKIAEVHAFIATNFRRFGLPEALG